MLFLVSMPPVAEILVPGALEVQLGTRTVGQAKSSWKQSVITIALYSH